MPAGTITVQGDLTVAPSAVLVAGIPGSPVNATLTVGGNLTVWGGATLLLGCAPSFGCSYTTSDVVEGSLIGNGPLAMIVHGDTVGAGVSIQGGGQGVNCAPNPLLSSFAGFPAPAFNTIEDTSISGGVAISGVQSCWMGFARNHVNGRVSFTNNTLADPDAMEIVTSTINGTLMCSGNSPVPQIGDSGGSPDVITGKAMGQCAGLAAD